MPLQYVAITDANRQPEEKDQVLKTYVYILHVSKFYIKHLFISCGK